MRDGEGRDAVSPSRQDVAGFQLHQLELEPDVAGGPKRQRQQLAQTARARDPKRFLARAQIERLQHAGQPEPMIGVEVGQKDLGQLHQSHRADQLTLGPFAAVEQDPVGAAPHQQRGQAATSSGNRAGGPGEEDREIHRHQSVSRGLRKWRQPSG